MNDEKLMQQALEALEDVDAVPYERVHAIVEALRARLAQPSTDLDEMTALKDAAYAERNKVVAGFAALAMKIGYAACRTRTEIEGWSDDWHGCVYIQLPTGQVSWHYHDSEAELFSFLPENAVAWDGHDTDEKYRRVLMLAQKPEQAEPVQPNEVLFAVEIPEGYGDVHPELLGEDAFSGKGWVRWRVVPTDEPNAEPTRNAVISFLLGEAPLDGVWFDEPHPTYKGRFWWREYLLKATEPSAEPVAYRYRYIDGWIECQPLYTTPTTRTPLTDEEINDEMDRLLLSPVEQEAFGSGVRYAERKHGIGEKK